MNFITLENITKSFNDVDVLGISVISEGGITVVTITGFIGIGSLALLLVFPIIGLFVIMLVVGPIVSLFSAYAFGLLYSDMA